VRLLVFSASGGMVVEGWLIVEVGFFEGLPGCRRLDESLCPSTLVKKGDRF